MGAWALVVTALVGATSVAPVSGGNSLTLPVQRHLVRMTPSDHSPVWLLAVQQEGTDGRGLGFFRSFDEGGSWSYFAPIQDDASHTDRAELLPDGDGLWVLYSFESPAGQEILGDARHDVVLQRWGYSGEGDWSLQSTVKVFDSTSDSTAFYRATMTRDDSGRLWVQAFRLDSNGTSAVVVANSSDGASWSRQTLTSGLPERGGGRIDAVNGKLLVLYDMHDWGTPARQFVRSNGSWSGPSTAFDEGVYHGAAFSSVYANGLLHVIYKDENEVLRYRSFDGSSWSSSQIVESRSDWAMQAAITEAAGELYVFYNRMVSSSSYELRMRRIVDGSLSGSTVLDGSSTWKGYLASAADLSGDATQVICAYGDVPDANSSGWVRAVRVSRSATGEPPPPPPPPPTNDAGTTTPPPPTSDGSLLFSDDFARQTNGLGASWSTQGVWYTDGRAITDADTLDLARVSSLSCADCRIQASVLGFGVPVVGVFVRGGAGTDRYEAALTGSGTVQIRKLRGGSATVLSSAAAGVSLSDPATLSLKATGSNPVFLEVAINGVVKAQASDGAADRLTAAGTVGLHADNAGVVFDSVRVYAASGTSTGGSGSTDAGTAVDAGTSDAGTGGSGSTADAGTGTGSIDAGTGGSGAVDAGTTDSGTGAADAGTGGAGSAGSELFHEDFSQAGSLSASWEAVKGVWFVESGRAQTDLDAQNLALESPLLCADCRAEVKQIGFGVPEVGLAVRASNTGAYDRYDLIVTGSNTLRLRRWRNGSATVLAEAPSGIRDVSDWSTLSLSATGTGPVTLTASVNGSVKLTFTDSASNAITAAGRAGMWTKNAGVVFDDFRIFAP